MAAPIVLMGDDQWEMVLSFLLPGSSPKHSRLQDKEVKKADERATLNPIL